MIGFQVGFGTFSKYLYLKSLQKSQRFSQMPLSENRRSMTLLVVSFHNTLISNKLHLVDFSQIYITLFQFGTLAKIGVIHTLIIRAFQSTKIQVFLKRIKKRHLFIHLRKFLHLTKCKLKIKTLIFTTLQYFIFSQILLVDSGRYYLQDSPKNNKKLGGNLRDS